MKPRHRGFILPIAALLLCAAAWLTVDALRGAALDRALAGASRERQRAFEAAEIGLALAEMDVRQERPFGAPREVPMDDLARAAVTTTLIHADVLPAGFSAGRVLALRLRSISDGHTAGGTRVTLERGFTQLQPQP